jgi:hypothetical protein
MYFSQLIKQRAFDLLDAALRRSVAEKVTEWMADNGGPMFSGALPVTLDTIVAQLKAGLEIGPEIVAQLKAGREIRPQVEGELLVAKLRFCETVALGRLPLTGEQVRRFVVACETTVENWGSIPLVDAGQFVLADGTYKLNQEVTAEDINAAISALSTLLRAADGNGRVVAEVRPHLDLLREYL